MGIFDAKIIIIFQILNHLFYINFDRFFKTFNGYFLKKIIILKNLMTVSFQIFFDRYFSNIF